MISVKNTPPAWLKMTAKMVVAEMLSRGWRVELYAKGSSFTRVTRPDGRQLDIHSSVADNVAHTACYRAGDKLLTYVHLKERELPALDLYVTEELDEEALAAAERFWQDGKRIVVKPLDAAHGHGVSVAVENAAGLKKAFTIAKDFSEKIIIQEYIQNAVELRALCIDGKLQAALVRIPARVTGDGKHTIAQLIEAENQSEKRGKSYTQNLSLIDTDKAAQWLGASLQHVPGEDELVQAVGTANVGTGGEIVDCTDDLPDWLVDITERTAEAMQLPVCGVDLLLAKNPAKSDTPSSLNTTILEVNANPSLFIHEHPTSGQTRPVVKAFVNSLE